MMSCPNKEKNTRSCTCTYAACPRHGLCCECVAYHLRAGEFPGCFFSKEGERAWDRSFANLVHDREKHR